MEENIKTVMEETDKTIMNETRPAEYTPKRGKKAVLSLASFTNDQLFAELKRRGFSGNLTINKTIVI